MSKISEPNFKTKKLERYKILWQISEASPIIRRYFAMNFFDGILTALGIVLAQFAFFSSGNPTKNKLLFFTSLITAMAIGISGLTGSHLAETAERRLNIIQMKQVLGLLDENGNKTNDSDVPKWSENDLQLALGKFDSIKYTKSKESIQYKHLGISEEQASKLGIKLGEPLQKKKEIGITNEKTSLKKFKVRKKAKKVENEQTIYEEAQHFAGIIAALVDGISPFAGVMIVVFPFIFELNGTTRLIQFIISFIFTVFVLFTLGGYLARLSKDSVIKYGMQMVMAAVLTSAITLLLNQLINFE